MRDAYSAMNTAEPPLTRASVDMGEPRLGLPAQAQPVPGAQRALRLVSTRRMKLLAGVLLGGARLELEANKWLVANDPRVMARLDDVRLARSEILLGPVVVDDMHSPRLNYAHMPDLTAIGAPQRA